MKIRNQNKQVAVCNVCSATSHKVVRTKTDDRALAARGVK